MKEAILASLVIVFFLFSSLFPVFTYAKFTKVGTKENSKYTIKLRQQHNFSKNF